MKLMGIFSGIIGTTVVSRCITNFNQLVKNAKKNRNDVTNEHGSTMKLQQTNNNAIVTATDEQLHGYIKCPDEPTESCIVKTHEIIHTLSNKKKEGGPI